MTKRTRLVGILLVVTAATLAAGGGAEEVIGLAEGGEMTFRMGLSGNPDTLDPQATSGTLTFQVVRSFYDTLVEPDETGQIVPALAEAWSVSEDYRTWVFFLRDDVVFHHGKPFGASDVVATIERLLAEETASPKASEFAQIERVRASSEDTVVFELSEPYAPMLASLASGWGAILPADLIASGHDFGTQPVGTGPFVFERWTPDARISMTRNEAYFAEGLPLVDRVELNIITEPTVQLQALLAGELDAIDMVAERDVAVLENGQGTKVERLLSSLVMVMAMNTSRPPLDDVEVRRAIATGIDKQTALDIAYGGGEPVSTFMDYSDPYYVDLGDMYAYNPTAARQMLDDAGFRQDRPLMMALPQNYEPHVVAGQLYQEMLKEIGVEVEIQLVDWSTWLSDVYRGGNYDLTVIGHTGKLDPSGRLAGYGTANTYVRWENPEVSALIDQARSEVEIEERRRLYGEALAIMGRDVPHVYIGSSYRYIGLRQNVTGFHMDAKLDTFDFRRVDLR